MKSDFWLRIVKQAFKKKKNVFSGLHLSLSLSLHQWLCHQGQNRNLEKKLWNVEKMKVYCCDKVEEGMWGNSWLINEWVTYFSVLCSGVWSKTRLYLQFFKKFLLQGRYVWLTSSLWIAEPPLRCFFFFFQPSASVWWTRHISGAHRGLLFLLKWCFVFCSWIESWWILMNTHSDDFRNCTKLSGGLADGHKVLPICFCCIKISLMFLSELHRAKKKKKECVWKRSCQSLS